MKLAKFRLAILPCPLPTIPGPVDKICIAFAILVSFYNDSSREELTRYVLGKETHGTQSVS